MSKQLFEKQRGQVYILGKTPTGEQKSEVGGRKDSEP